MNPGNIWYIDCVSNNDIASQLLKGSNLIIGDDYDDDENDDDDIGEETWLQIVRNFTRICSDSSRYVIVFDNCDSVKKDEFKSIFTCFRYVSQSHIIVHLVFL
jgi:hypothetical protein